MTIADYQDQETEAQFSRRVTDYAVLRGWSWMHIRPALNQMGKHRTPVSGPLGAGWPDLVMVRGERLLFAELKAQRKYLTDNQKRVTALLSSVPCVEVHVWRPSDWALLLDVLA